MNISFQDYSPEDLGNDSQITEEEKPMRFKFKERFIKGYGIPDINRQTQEGRKERP